MSTTNPTRIALLQILQDCKFHSVGELISLGASAGIPASDICLELYELSEGGFLNKKVGDLVMYALKKSKTSMVVRELWSEPNAQVPTTDSLQKEVKAAKPAVRGAKPKKPKTITIAGHEYPATGGVDIREVDPYKNHRSGPSIDFNALLNRKPKMSRLNEAEKDQILCLIEDIIASKTPAAEVPNKPAPLFEMAAVIKGKKLSLTEATKLRAEALMILGELTEVVQNLNKVLIQSHVPTPIRYGEMPTYGVKFTLPTRW